MFAVGDTVVLCVNNLGALSCLEMAVVTRAAISCLGKTHQQFIYQCTFTVESFNCHFTFQMAMVVILADSHFSPFSWLQRIVVSLLPG